MNRRGTEAQTRSSIVVGRDADADEPIVYLTGEFDLAARDLLAQRLALLESSERRPVVLDLTGTTFIDSGIVGVLVAAHRNGLDFRIRGASGLPRHTLQLLAIPHVFPFED